MKFDSIKEYAHTIIVKNGRTMHERVMEIMALVTDAIEGKIDGTSIKTEIGSSKTRVKISVIFPQPIIDSIKDSFWITDTNIFLARLDDERPEWLYEVLFNGDYNTFTMIVQP